MRRTILLLAMLLAMATQLAAQQALYFHYKNGKSFACEPGDISSITYDKSPGSEVYDLQVIRFKDNSRQVISFNEIDSVGFHAPAPVLAENGVVLDSSYEDYLVRGDTVSFTMRKDTPAAMLPRVGDIVGSTFDNTVFEDGIVARVVSVRETADGLEFACEKATVDELYDEIFYYGYGDIYQPVGDQPAPRRAKGDLELKGTKELWNIDRSLKAPKLLMDDYAIDVEANFASTGKVKIYMYKPKGGEMYARFNFATDLDVSLALGLAGRNSISHVTPLFSLGLGVIATPCPVIFFKPSLELGIYNEAVAELKGSMKASVEADAEFQVELNKGQWSATTVRNTFNAGLDEFALSLNGWYGIGLEPKVFMSLCGTKTGVSLAMRTGAQVNANFTMDFVDYLADGSMYNAVKDSKLSLTTPLKGILSAQVGLFKESKNLFSYTFLSLSKSLFSAYFLPDIGYASVDQKGNTIHASAGMSQRNLIKPLKVQVGFAAFDDDNRLVDKKYVGTFEDKVPSQTIAADFTLPSGKDYVVAPIVNIFGCDMRADRSDPVVPGEAVDLGLSVAWSSTNLGADAIYSLGERYKWGMTIPSRYVGTDWVTHPLYDPDGGGYPRVGSTIAGNASYDPCTAWGEGWQMPTTEQWEELIEKCTFEFVRAIPRPDPRSGETEGIKVTGPNGNHIYLPTQGSLYYWTSSRFMGLDETIYVEWRPDKVMAKTSPYSAVKADVSVIKSTKSYVNRPADDCFIRPVRVAAD